MQGATFTEEGILSIVLHDYCPRCSRSWDECRCLWMTETKTENNQ